MYLNQFDFLYNAVGIKSAAKVYFNCEASELDRWKSAHPPLPAKSRRNRHIRGFPWLGSNARAPRRRRSKPPNTAIRWQQRKTKTAGRAAM